MTQLPFYPYPGLYQFTIALEVYTEPEPELYMSVDGTRVAYMANWDDTDYDNSLILTRNLHLHAGQVVTVDAFGVGGVWGDGGKYSWFTGHLIYAD